jgi:CBS domain-containing protein
MDVPRRRVHNASDNRGRDERAEFNGHEACWTRFQFFGAGARTMLCHDLMKTAVRCVPPEATVEDAAAIMRDEGIGFLPVCDARRHVLGTITDRDIAIRVVAAGESPAQALRKFMTREVVACRPGDDLDYAQELMSQERVSRIMCIDESGELQGVISLSDLANIEGKRASATLRDVSDREVRP